MTRRSAFFFVGHFVPDEGANFNIQNKEIAGNGVLEVLGADIGLWWRHEPQDLDPLLRRTVDWVLTLASSYYLAGNQALDVRLNSWVEVRDVDAKEAVIGFLSERFIRVKAPSRQTARTHPLLRAVPVTEALVARSGDPAIPHLQQAAREAWRAALTGGDEAFLSAFRAIECLRRTYDPRWEQRAAAMRNLGRDLSPDKGALALLEKAAKAVRHGDRPDPTSSRHPITAARCRRAELLDESTRLVREAFRSHSSLRLIDA